MQTCFHSRIQRVFETGFDMYSLSINTILLNTDQVHYHAWYVFTVERRVLNGWKYSAKKF